MSKFTELPNVWIQLPDGRKLSARIWLPLDAQKSPVPAILEYLPYRKRDGTAPRDESTYPVFAAAGYAGVQLARLKHDRFSWDPQKFSFLYQWLRSDFASTESDDRWWQW